MNSSTSPCSIKVTPKTSPSKKWTSQTNEEFLVQLHVPKIDDNEIAARMGGDTVKAVKCQFHKLEKQSRGNQQMVGKVFSTVRGLGEHVIPSWKH